MASEGFFEQVYEVVEQIPEGMVATYSQVALLAGRARSARYGGMRCIATHALVKFPVIAWCLPMAVSVRALPLAVPMLSASS